VVLAADDVRRNDGKAVLLLVGAVALVFVALVVWIRLGGTTPGPLPPIPENPSAVLSAGQRIVFAAGDLSAGDSLLCENQGVLVGAWVPKPGHTARAQLVGSQETAAIVIRTRPDGVVVARC
jgi:nitric oxide reductase large subunit